MVNLKKPRAKLTAAALILVFLTAFIYAYQTRYGYVTYIQDPVNTCWYSDGQATTTNVGYTGVLPEKRIRKENEKAFVQQFQQANQCWSKK